LNTKTANIKDKWLFIFVYPVMGISFVHIGNDNPLNELVLIPSYYTDILLAIAVTYLLGFYLRWIFKRRENHLDWETQLKSRIKFQLLWGLFFPTLFAVAVELIYLSILDISVENSPIFYLELPLTIVYLILINLIYFFLYSRQHTSTLRSALKKQEMVNDLSQEKFLIAKQGNQNIHLPNSSIAYFILKDKLTFLVTVDNRQLLFDKTMKEVMDLLPKHQFYRLNRQLIARRNCITKCTPTSTRRLKVELDPPLNQDIFLPKANVSLFMTWLNQT